MKLGVLFIHGMGHSEPGFSARCERMLRDYVGRKGCAELAFGEAVWAADMNVREAELMKRMAPKVDKDRIRRGLIVGGFGDVTQYVAARSDGGPAYRTAMHRVSEAVLDIERRATTKEERDAGLQAPFVVISHSLGCLVAADFMKGDGNGRVKSWVTLGCNLPLFYLAGYGMDAPPPLAKLPDGSKPWVNTYDPDDVFGFPMQPLDDAHAALCRDFAINTGGILRAHTGYWSDKDFVSLAGDHLNRARKALL